MGFYTMLVGLFILGPPGKKEGERERKKREERKNDEEGKERNRNKVSRVDNKSHAEWKASEDAMLRDSSDRQYFGWN